MHNCFDVVAHKCSVAPQYNVAQPSSPVVSKFNVVRLSNTALHRRVVHQRLMSNRHKHRCLEELFGVQIVVVRFTGTKSYVVFQTVYATVQVTIIAFTQMIGIRVERTMASANTKPIAIHADLIVIKRLRVDRDFLDSDDVANSVDTKNLAVGFY